MLSTVLRSRRAIEVNIAIMRTFVKLRQLLVSHEELARKLAALENRYDVQFKGRLRRDPRTHGATSPGTQADRLSAPLGQRQH